ASACLENATAAAASGFFVWAAREAERWPRFQSEIERLRRLAAGTERAGYPRTTGPLTRRGWGELEREFAEAQRLDQADRPRAWKNTPLPTGDGLRHLRDYLRGCRKAARVFLGHEAL